MDHEASVDLAESGATSVSGSPDAEVPDIVLVPDTDKGQYMNHAYANSMKNISQHKSIKPVKN